GRLGGGHGRGRGGRRPRGRRGCASTLAQAGRRRLLAEGERVDEQSGGEDQQLDRGGVELGDVVLDRVDVDGGGDLVLDHHRHEDRARRCRNTEAGRDVRAVPDHHVLVAEDGVELRNEPGSRVETLDHLVVAAGGGET